MTIEGEKDDICGVGQTEAAHDLCTSIPAEEQFHYLQPGVGHYGVFNGTRYRTEIQPRIREMIRTIEARRKAAASRQPLIELVPASKAVARVVPPVRWDDIQPSGKPN